MTVNLKKGFAAVSLVWLTACSGQTADLPVLESQPMTAKASSARKKTRERFTAKRKKPVVTAGLLAFAADVEAPTVTPEVEEPARDRALRNPDFCPAYTESSLFRRRGRTVRVRPGDDWIDAVESAGPGTEVLFAPGEYRIGGELNVDVGAGVTLRGATGDPRDVVLKGDGYHVESEGVTIRGRNVTIADLSVTGTRAHAIFIKGDQDTHGVQLYNVRLYDTGTQQVKLTPGGASGGLIACSEIFYNPGKVRGDYVHAIDLHGAVNWVIRDNYIHDIEGEHNGCYVDISCQTYTSGPAILVWNEARGTVVERNVLIDNFRNIAFGLGRSHEGGVIRNNFIWRTKSGEGGIELQNATNTRVLHNTIYLADFPHAMEARQASGVRFINNLTNSPIWDRGGAQFTVQGDIHDAQASDFATRGDYRLRPRSQAVGAGVAISRLNDIEGRARPSQRPDVGCSQVD